MIYPAPMPTPPCSLKALFLLWGWEIGVDSQESGRWFCVEGGGGED